MYYKLNNVTQLMSIESPLENPDKEDCNQGNYYSPYEDFTLINFSSWVVIIILLLDEVRFESEQQEPNNDTDNKEPKEVEPPVISNSTMIVMMTYGGFFHAFFS